MANLLLGITPTLSPVPNDGALQADPDFLTDGATVIVGEGPGYALWRNDYAVTWLYKTWITITFDLGELKALDQIAISQGVSEEVAQVYDPKAIRIILQNDDDEWIDVGDAMANPSEPYVPYISGAWLKYDLKCAAKQVKVMVLPNNQVYSSDEITLEEGDAGLLTVPPSGTEVTGTDAEHYLYLKVADRYNADETGIEAAIDATSLSEPTKAGLQSDLQAALSLVWGTGLTWKTILPLSTEHESVYAVLGALWDALGRSEIVVDQVNPFAAGSLYGTPGASSSEISIVGLEGEKAFVALNFYCQSDETIDFWFSDILDAATPSYITAYKAHWSDTYAGTAVQNLLAGDDETDQQLTPSAGKWTFTAKAGLVQQIFLVVDLTGLSSDNGYLIVGDIEIPLSMEITQRSNYAGGDTYHTWLWDYTAPLDEQTTWMGTASAELLNALRAYDVSPWTSVTLVNDPTKIAAWVDAYPDAPYYFLFAYYAFSGKSESVVKSKTTAVADAFRAKGIDVSKVVFHVYDEVDKDSENTLFEQWAGWVKEAEPDVLIFSDPSFDTPSDYASHFALVDILAPHIGSWDSDQTAYYQSLDNVDVLAVYTGGNDSADTHSLYRAKAWWAIAVGASGYSYWSATDIVNDIKENDGFGVADSSWYAHNARGDRRQFFIAENQFNFAKPFFAIVAAQQDFALLTGLRTAANNVLEQLGAEYLETLDRLANQ